MYRIALGREPARRQWGGDGSHCDKHSQGCAQYPHPSEK